MTFEERQADIDAAVAALDTISPRNDDHEVWLAALDIFTAHDVTNAARDLVKARAGITIARDSLEALSAEYDSFEGAGQVVLEPASLVLDFPLPSASVSSTNQTVALSTPTSLTLSYPLHAVARSTGEVLPVWAQPGFFDNVGLVDESALVSAGSVTVSSPANYVNQDFTNLVVTAGGAGSTFFNCRVRGNNPYNVDIRTTGEDSVVFTHCYFESTRVPPTGQTGAKNLYGGGTYYDCHFFRGGDCIHVAPGRSAPLKLYRCLVEEQDIYAGDHSDAVQMTENVSGPSNPSYPVVGTYPVSWWIIEDSVLQARWNNSNGCQQIYTGMQTGPCYSRRNWLHGGTYSIGQTNSGGSFPYISDGDYFAWQTQKNGLMNIGTRQNSKWWTRQLRPRRVGAGGGFTPAGDGDGFPGNGVPITSSTLDTYPATS